MAMKDMRITIDVTAERTMKVRDCYAEYDPRTGMITGFGRASSPKYKAMDFEPAFEAILYDRKNRICGTAVAESNGVFTRTGQMVFHFEFEGVPEFYASHITLMLIAKEEPEFDGGFYRPC